ncbi:MAG: NAD(+) diphosphatase [Myxococcota bacterium]
MDRSEGMRRDGGALDAAWANESARVLPFWKGRVYVDGGRPPEPIFVTPQEVEAHRSGPRIFLGMRNEGPLFAAALGVDDPRAQGFDAKFADPIRSGAFMASPSMALVAYARAMVLWHAQSRFCDRCGTATDAAEGGFVRVCPGCGHRHFPRTDPAVMMLITRDGESERECLLARQGIFPKGMYSALAGFVEPGESLEECVRRETDEEVGLRLRDVRYVGSEPWPFPCQLMVGFVAEAEPGEIVLDEEELEEARWVPRSALLVPSKERAFFYPPPISLAHRMIRAFADGTFA